VPYNTRKNSDVDTDILYENMMHKYRWGNLEQPGLYLDENATRMSKTFRIMFAKLATYLYEEEKPEKTKEVLDYALKVIPHYNVPYHFRSTYTIASIYYRLGEINKAKELYDILINSSLKTLRWFSKFNAQQYYGVWEEVGEELYFLKNLFQDYQEINPDAYNTANEEYLRYRKQFEQYYIARQSRQGGGANR